MTERLEFNRRELLRLAGAGIVAGTFGAGTASGARGRYIVGTADERATRVVRAEADSVHRVLDFGRIGQAVAGTFPEAALEGLRKRPDVRYIEPDGLMEAIEVDAGDAEYPWGVDRVDAEVVHDAHTGAGAHIAIVDTGIDSDHPDLPNLGDGAAFVEIQGGYAEPWDDDSGHGTHCAGIAAAVRNAAGVVGVSPGATLHAVKVLGADGFGPWSAIADGIRWVADRGYDVASMSLGGDPSLTVQDACLYAYERGVLLVAAAGNNGCESKYTVDDYSCDGCVKAPAVYDTVVAVSSTDADDSPSSFSSAGCTVELAAPGSAILSTVPGGGVGTKSGTSMACPHVSGAAALLMAGGLASVDTTTDFENPGGARQRLRETAERRNHDGKTLVPDGTTRNNLYGYGLLDVEAAVGAPSDPSTPSAPTIDRFDASSSSPKNPHVDVEIVWEVSGDPTAVTLELYEGGIESGEAPLRSWSVGAAGSQSYGEKFASPKTYTARLVASNDGGAAEATDAVSA